MIDVIQVPKQDAALCYEFAVKSVDSNMSEYVQRSQANRTKVISDIYIGKMAEMAVCRFFYSKEIRCSYPDFKVYNGFRKNYTPDLKLDKTCGIHVKCQSQNIAERYGLSWSFQSKDKLISEPKENDYIALCLSNGDEITFIHFVKAEHSIDKYKDPQKVELTTKKVLYNEDLYEINSSLGDFVSEFK